MRSITLQMNSSSDPRFFALLVHEGLLSPATARDAMAAKDPLQYLLDAGAVTEEGAGKKGKECRWPVRCYDR